MELNLPILDRLAGSESILIAGMGGGFDVLCGLPIYFELRRRGKQVHLGNLSFSDLEGLTGEARLTPTLARVSADYSKTINYFPELYLSRWFRELRGEDVPVWCFEKSGVRPLATAYQALARELAIDAILLVDGGVDCLLHGDEPSLGTVLEDTLSLLVVSELNEVPVRLVCSVGLGVERDMSFAHVFENIAELAREGAFLGSCSLVRRMPSYSDYESAVAYVHSQPYQESSVINASVISAVRGHYGNYHLTERTKGSQLWINPLMALYWFFELKAVARHNLLIPSLYYTDTFQEVIRASYESLGSLIKRSPERIPLS